MRFVQYALISMKWLKEQIETVLRGCVCRSPR